MQVQVGDLESTFAWLSIRTHMIPWENRIAFCLVAKPVNSETYAQAVDMMFQPVKPGDALKPTFSIKRDEAQELMDELYRVGLRPSEAGTVGELAAVRSHLRDMRVLVAQALDTPEMLSRSGSLER